MMRESVTKSKITYSIVGGGIQLGLFTNAELGDTFIPATDNLANTNRALERFIAITRGIELGAVFKGTSVVDSDRVTLGGEVLAITSLVRFDTIKKESNKGQYGKFPLHRMFFSIQ